MQRQHIAGATVSTANLGLEHLDILVPDTAEFARFYTQVFDTALHQQPFRDSIRWPGHRHGCTLLELR